MTVFFCYYDLLGVKFYPEDRGRFSVLSKLVRKSFDYLSKPMLIFVKKLKTENRPLSYNKL